MNKPVFYLGCFVKMAMAFFSISFSSRKLAFSRFNLRSSSSSGLRLPLPGNAYSGSALNCRSHLYNVFSWTPILSAASVTLYPCSLIILMASSLKALSKCLRSIMDTSDRFYYTSFSLCPSNRGKITFHFTLFPLTPR
jgi:hypothetical protein